VSQRGPSDPADHAEWALRRRRAAMAHHPDRGGQSEKYLAALAAVDRAFGLLEDRDSGPGVPVQVQTGWRPTARRVLRRGRRKTFRRWRAAQHRLPRWVPGARRFTDI